MKILKGKEVILAFACYGNGKLNYEDRIYK